MMNPVSTYRLQLHAGFTLTDLEQVLSYLQKLGVQTIYASPIFEAVPGSTHGYDALDPHRINPEVGTLQQLQHISDRLKQNGLFWLQDIVPNHMAFDTRNPWVMDILEKGRHSKYASFFDVSWNSTVYNGKLMVPFLGASLKEVIDKGELKLVYKEPRLTLAYFDAVYPLGLSSYQQVLEGNGAQDNEAVQQFLQQVRDMHSTEDTIAFAERFDELQLQLASLLKNEQVRSYIEERLAKINQDPEQLLQLAEGQIYRLCNWQETDYHINYRRFFTVNGLICLNIQDETVFDPFHQFIASLIEQKIIDGLRIDHIDGLYDPTQYLSRLKNRVGPTTYTVVEKILQQQEQLPDNWSIEGTTGYDFLSMVNNLLTHPGGEKVLAQFYRQLVPDNLSIDEQVNQKKAHILYQHMNGELENLCQLLMISSLEEDSLLMAISPDTIKKAIGEFLIGCPVYRFYGNAFPLKEEEQHAIHAILEAATQRQPHLSAGFELLETIFLKRPLQGDKAYNERALHFYQRCMQFSGPLMAKGVEDTLMYTYNQLIAHNEVGDQPGGAGISTADFHQKMIERSEQWPLSMNTTSTHDTKRGEDVRARLQVLTALSGEWMANVLQWMKLNKELKQGGRPDVNDEYFIYQSLLGAYPMPGEAEEDFGDRFTAYLQKAGREAKLHSNWAKPDKDYEETVQNFAGQLLNKDRAFWKSFTDFHSRIAEAGILHSLVQVLLKYTCPGIPDLYQGTELWDLSLVDPDNRRPVDYAKRTRLLNEIEGSGKEAISFESLWEHRYSGKIKLWLVHQLLEERKKQSDLWGYGDYIPLATEGVYKDHVVAFARRLGKTVYIMAAPLHTAALLKGGKKSRLQPDWKDTQILLPFDIHSTVSVFERQQKHYRQAIRVKDLFKSYPFALLKAERVLPKRAAGILTHISSLPSRFGIGDLGPGAKAFADFLHRSYQRYWQLLPLNPVEQGQGYSPYSSTSSRAGNYLFISPEALVTEGLLSTTFLEKCYLPDAASIDYHRAETTKKELLTEAWKNFQQCTGTELHAAFQTFCQQEKEWLDDFARYEILKQLQEGSPWYEWPDHYKHRSPEALQALDQRHAPEMNKVKWIQFLFFRQWQALKDYCNEKGIQLIGDLPFYISYDSVDVWSHRQLFMLDEDGNRLAMAGVPPDAFSEDGQLWGMPVFNWEALKAEGYKWWMKRLQKNRELFDLVRLDHFRAFSAYWEVPAGETTARNGSWQKGPAIHFFKAVKNALGGLPFIAEDLGDIDKPVYQLRDQLQLPGMNVLQFAFGEDMPVSNHTPHNYSRHSVVYTGTHDNNTSLGWYRTENEKTRKRLEGYLGREIREEAVAHMLCRMAYASVSDTVIIPIQDLLGLDEGARMNTPSSTGSNWLWRLLPDQITTAVEKGLRNWVKAYNRV